LYIYILYVSTDVCTRTRSNKMRILQMSLVLESIHSLVAFSTVFGNSVTFLTMSHMMLSYLGHKALSSRETLAMRDYQRR
jgi:hypothetical protein